MYNTKEAAKILNTYPDRVGEFIRKGKLRGRKENNRYVVEEKDLEEFRANYSIVRYSRDGNVYDDPEEVAICLNCTVPGECNPRSPNCGLRKLKKYNF